jgi:hypothetical protein
MELSYWYFPIWWHVSFRDRAIFIWGDGPVLTRTGHRHLYAPATIDQGAYCFTPVRPSVRSSHLVCIVCPANSSYSFWARPFIFCRVSTYTEGVHIIWILGFQQFLTKLCIYELSDWNLLTGKLCSLYCKSTDIKTWFSLKYASDMKQIAPATIPLFLNELCVF